MAGTTKARLVRLFESLPQICFYQHLTRCGQLPSAEHTEEIRAAEGRSNTFWFLRTAWVKPDALRMAYLVNHKYTIVVIASASFAVSLLFCYPGLGSLVWWAFSDFSSGNSNLKGYSGGKYKCNISSEIQMSNKGVIRSQGPILQGIRNCFMISIVTCSLVPLRCIFICCF